MSLMINSITIFCEWGCLNQVLCPAFSVEVLISDEIAEVNTFKLFAKKVWSLTLLFFYLMASIVAISTALLSVIFKFVSI